MTRSEKDKLLLEEWWLLIKKRGATPKNRKPYKRKHLDGIDRAIATNNARSRLNQMLLLKSGDMLIKRPVWGN